MLRAMGMEPERQRARADRRLAAWALLVSTACGPSACLDAASRGAGPAATAPSTQSTSATEAGADMPAPGHDDWSEVERALLRSMRIEALPPPPDDPSNRVADDAAAAELGHRLFFDARLSSNGEVACARCHQPERDFTDGLARSVGLGTTERNAPTLVGAAWSPWLYWDGRRDSLWAQALAPIESALEMNGTRVEAIRLVGRDPIASALYLEAFGEPVLPGLDRPLPEKAGPFGDEAARTAWSRMSASDRQRVDRAFAQLGKALAAYQRMLRPGRSRFDRYAASVLEGRPPAADSTLRAEERLGLRLFLDSGRTQCLRCHNGPLFTNQGFHRVGTDRNADGIPEFGRFLGLQAALVDPFNCLGASSDAAPEQCRELRFVDRTHLDAEMGKFKTPTLRGLRRTAPYMHDGRFASLFEVVDHYLKPPPDGPGTPGGHELLPLMLTAREREALVAFLGTLDGGIESDPRWLAPPPMAAPSAPPARGAAAEGD